MNTTTSSDAAPQAPLVSLRQQARWLPADMDTPISLYLGMVGRQDGILLESAEVDGRWGRYSVLACDMALYARCREGRLDLRIEDARLAPLAVLQGLPFVEGLRRLMQGPVPGGPGADRRPSGHHPRPLRLGGLRHGLLFQPRLATVMPPEEAESMLVLPGTQLVFDHLYNRLCQIGLGEHREVRGSRDAEGSFSVSGDVRADPGEAGYKAMVEKIEAMLHQGEAIQVVPSVNFSVACEGDPFVLYRRMRRYNASPYMFFMRLADFCFWGPRRKSWCAARKAACSCRPSPGRGAVAGRSGRCPTGGGIAQ